MLFESIKAIKPTNLLLSFEVNVTKQEASRFAGYKPLNGDSLN